LTIETVNRGKKSVETSTKGGAFEARGTRKENAVSLIPIPTLILGVVNLFYPKKLIG